MKNDVHADWEVMHNAFKSNMELLEKIYTVYLDPDHCIVDSQRDILMKPGIKPLHVKWHTVYHAILKLQAKSVFEFGFGFGHNLRNLQVLSPDIEVTGIDISQRQYDHTIAHEPRLKDHVFVWDGADRLDASYDNSVDVAFSRGVIMFLARHIDVIHNMFSEAKNQVVLLEGWHAHNFYQDIKIYAESERFPWSDLHMYSYDTGIKDVKDPIRAMICSRQPIEGKWAQLLTSDAELRSN